MPNYNMADRFWLDDFKILYENKAYLNFIPTKEMTRTEQSNAISRLCFYAFFIILLFGNTTKLLIIPIVTLILVIIFYNLPKVQRIKSKEDKDNAQNIKDIYTLDEYRLFKEGTCRRPTKDNPLMNLTAEDYNRDVSQACNADEDNIVKTQIDDNLDKDLYKDIEDVFDRKNSERQFFTGTQDIKYDSEKFARWCYKFPPTCKTNQERCLNYADYRIL